MNFKFGQQGSLLLEILLAVMIAAIIIGAVASLTYVGSKSGQIAGAKNAAVALAEEGMEAMQSISEISWHNVYLPPSGSGNADSDKGDLKPYYVYKNGSVWALGAIVNGDEGNIDIDGIIYSRKIYIYNTDRKNTPEKPICTDTEACLVSEKIKDPSTQKIKIIVSKAGDADTVLEEYLTRWKNETSSQSDWSGGSGQADFIDPSKFDSVDLYDSKETIDYMSVPGSIKLKPL